MSDLELLFLVLALLYGWECGCWTRRGSVLFRSWLGRRWQIVHPGLLLGNQRGGYLFAHPLPPLGTLLTGNQFPLSLSSEGVLAFVASSVNPGGRPLQTGKYFRFDEIRSLEPRGKKLRVNGELLLTAASPTLARHLAEQLRQLQKLPAPKREGAIQQMLRESLDARAIERRWQEFRKLTSGLRLLANGPFGYLFLCVPIVIMTLGLRQSWLALVAGLFALTLTTALRFRRVHKHFYPEAEDERFSGFLMTLLWPASAIRAHDSLSRPLLETFHPLALAKVFCAEETFREFARNILREIRHPGLPLCPRADPAAQAAERQTRLLWQNAVEQFLKQNGIDPDELTRAPAQSDETCRAYCPRCLAQFTSSTGVCDDCGGLDLVPFPTPTTQAQAPKTNSAPPSCKK